MRTAASVLCWRKVLPRRWPQNFGDEDYTEVYAQVRETARSCLETVFPGAIIFDPVAAFGGSNDTADPNQLLSSSGLSIWAKGIRCT